MERCESCPQDEIWQKEWVGVEFPYQKQRLQLNVSCPCGQFRSADRVRWYKVCGQCRTKILVESNGAGDCQGEAPRGMVEEEDPLVDDPIEEGWEGEDLVNREQQLRVLLRDQ